jgi:imidazolonepropionase-like amidohydrolase
MKRFIILLLTTVSFATQAQETVYPAPAQSGAVLLRGATVHAGNGQVITEGIVMLDKGKITYVGTNLPDKYAEAKQFDLTGKHVYPGLILSQSTLGLIEVSSVRATADASEIGEINPSIRSIVAYNTDSKVINTLKSNGILLAQVVPQGGVISGSSSVVQLDAWNWEDAAYKMENGIHFNMPALINRPNPFAAFFNPGAPTVDPLKQGLDQIEKVKAFFRAAKAYLNDPTHEATNLKYEAVKGLFNKTQKFFIHCNLVKEMLVAIDFVKEFGFDMVIEGGSDSWLIADLLKQNNIPVILSQMHSLPTMQDDDVDQPYKTPALLQKAGVLFSINDEDGQTRGRNLMFNAGTAVTYGLSKEEALSAITLNAAKILGIDKQTGSIEVGKDANIVVSDGDILDMKSSTITHAFIQGRQADLTDKHKQLYERYKHKYGIK